MPLTELKVDRVPGLYPGASSERLRVIVKTLDTRTGKPTAIQHIYALPDLDMIGMGDQTESYMLDHLRRLLRDVAQHEADEWFKRDGEILFDPHLDKATGRIHA